MTSMMKEFFQHLKVHEFLNIVQDLRPTYVVAQSVKRYNKSSRCSAF